MAQKSALEGTKIAQAAKDLNVTTVTIRRYVAEFNIKTATDDNGIKVLPQQAMEELAIVRQLKEDGLSNAQVLDMLADKRKSYAASEANNMEMKEEAVDNSVEDSAVDTSIDDSEEKEITASEGEEAKTAEGEEADKLDTKPKHALVCQTCGKNFEHSNPRLRDCLDCYRTKRKERRRGSSKHKNVILHPLAQQAANKNAQLENGSLSNSAVVDETGLATEPSNGKTHASTNDNNLPVLRGNAPVRSYRKAIEETRYITSSLKRRLERPDLPEGERRWLEQVYAYQLILHQGWRHLSEYKTNPSE